MSDSKFKPGVAAIIIIAIGLLILILLFIFAKRQIMRVAQKFPTNGPHTPIGYQAPKDLLNRIEQCLDNIKLIRHEPMLLNADNVYCSEMNANKYNHIYRMKTVDQFKELENFIYNSYGDEHHQQQLLNGITIKRRHPNDDIRTYLLNLQQQKNGPLNNCDPSIINEIIDIYIHARHQSEPDFGHEQYQRFEMLLKKLKEQIIPIYSFNNDTSISTTLRTSPTKIVQRKPKSLTSNLSFKNLTNLTMKDNTNPTNTVIIDDKKLNDDNNETNV